MDYFQLDHVGVSLVTALVLFITAWYATQLFGRRSTTSAETQTSQVSTNCAQTETMRFTEQLTNYGDKKVDLRDKFDKSCEICEANISSEAVGFCKMCETFLCLNCCKHHEKISLSHCHVLLGKDKFNGVRNKKKLFDKKFALYDNYYFNKIYCPLNYYSEQHLYDHYNQFLCLAPNQDNVLNLIGCFIRRKLPNDQLVILKQENISGQTKEKSILSGYCWPAGICAFTSTSQVCGWYFTVPAQKKIYKYMHTENCAVKCLCTLGECYGIALFNGGLAISLKIETSFSLPEWQVQFISYEGNVHKQICYDNEEDPLLKEPKHLTSNDAKDILFVSDQGYHSVIALDIKGYVLFKYTHETIKSPMGITCDDEGNIYVASGNKVVQIDQHGTKSRVILSSKENRSKMVIDVCYNKFTGELGVLSQSSVITILKPLP